MMSCRDTSLRHTVCHVTGTRWLFFVVFDILYAEGSGDGGHGDGGAIEEVVRDAVRNSIAPCPPPSEVQAGNLTVRGSTM